MAMSESRRTAQLVNQAKVFFSPRGEVSSPRRAPRVEEAFFAIAISAGARGVLLRRALGTLGMTEAEGAGALHGGEAVARERQILQGLPAPEPLGVLGEQLGASEAADLPHKMSAGLGAREGLLLGARQGVEVVAEGPFEVAQVVVGATAAAPTQAEPEPSPPADKAADQGGMFGQGPTLSGALFLAQLTESYQGLSVTRAKAGLATTFFTRGGRPGPGGRAAKPAARWKEKPGAGEKAPW